MSVVDSLLNVFSHDLNIFKKGGWMDAFLNEDLKSKYESLKPVLKEKYGADAAKFIGYLEDSEDLWDDVRFASDETGVDANLLYSIGMQEGFARRGKREDKYLEIEGDWILQPRTESFYDSKRVTNTMNDIGLDVFFNIQDTLLEKGYLKSKINSLDDLFSGRNEAGDSYLSGNVFAHDAWRAVGASIREYEDNLINIFNNRDLDFTSLNDNDKSFWIYSAFNAGPGNTASLLDTFGTNPLEHDTVKKALELYGQTNEYDIGTVTPGSFRFGEKVGKERIEKAQNYYNYMESSQLGLAFMPWMQNVGRTVGSKELIDVYNPFSFEAFGSR